MMTANEKNELLDDKKKKDVNHVKAKLKKLSNLS